LKDVLEFATSLDRPHDTACGHTISISLTAVRRLWLQYAFDYRSPIDKMAVESMIRIFYPKIPEINFKKIVNTIIDSDLTAKRTNSYHITTVNKYFIIMLRDATEFWTQEFEDIIVSKYLAERIRFEHFIEVVNAHFVDISDDMAETRFLECCRSSVNPTVTQLHCRDLACTF
jgi:hypothetical protein